MSLESIDLQVFKGELVRCEWQRTRDSNPGLMAENQTSLTSLLPFVSLDFCGFPSGNPGKQKIYA
jgi:hypothetical protein